MSLPTSRRDIQVPLAQASVHDDAALESFRRRHRLDPYHLKRMWHAVIQEGRSFPQAMSRLPSEVRDAFGDSFQPHPLRVVERADSGCDGATKLVLETLDGGRLETVILRCGSGRTSLCVSSQIGCAAGCAFCATGYMQGVRNLTVEQILDQVIQAGQLLRDEGRRVRNVVFMGMGEPFHNMESVLLAVRLLQRRDRFQISAKRILVSTVGVPAAMVRFANEFPRAGLALSLHSVDPQFRSTLIPLARKHSLEAIRSALQSVNERQAGPVMIEYLLLRGRNDRPSDAEDLADYLSGLRTHVNLIPYNTIAQAPHLETTGQAERERFGGLLRSRGLTVTIRYSQGSDIDAACGQLAQ